MAQEILLGVCTYKYVPSICMANLVGNIIDMCNNNLLREFHCEADMYITTARNKIVSRALELYEQKAATHVLMVDDDMILPLGTAKRLLERNVDVVGAAYYTRDLKPVVYEVNPFRFLDSIPLEGLHKIGGLGAGCLMIKIDVLRKMYNNGIRHMFANTIEVDKNGEPVYLGEDVHFFKRLAEMGIPSYIDCDIQCGHAGVAIIDQSTWQLKEKMGGIV
jgi:hypothetical protein